METQTETKPNKKIVSASINMSDGVKELERCFTEFNKLLFQNKLPRPVITVQAAGRKNAYGWFAPDAWTMKKNRVCEINLSAEWLSRTVDLTLGTLLHEMVHLDNAMKGLKDCDPRSQHHNKLFKLGAERVGFIVEQTEKGWSKTVLSPDLKALIEKMKPNADVLGIFRGMESGAKAKKGSKLKKWSCGCCNIRVAVSDFDATCNLCGNNFEEME